MNAEQFEKLLNDLQACSDARAWSEGKSLAEAWGQCERGDWMLWLAAKTGVGRKLVVAAACGCARVALKYVPIGEDRPRIAIETAEAWICGEVTIKQVRAAAAAAYAAAYAAYNAAAYAAADAAAYAAYAAAAYAAYDAAAYAYAADAAAYAAYAARGVRSDSLKASASIVRRHITVEAIEAQVAKYVGSKE